MNALVKTLWPWPELNEEVARQQKRDSGRRMLSEVPDSSVGNDAELSSYSCLQAPVMSGFLVLAY